MWWLVVAQVVVPLGLIAWVAWGKPGDRFAWLLARTTTLGYLAAIALVGIWLIPPRHALLVYVLLFAAALGRSHLRGMPSAWRPVGILAWGRTAAWATAAAAVTAAVVYGLAGRAAPLDALSLSFPLGPGKYYVPNGGANILLNAHVATLREQRYRPFRGQSYGVDLIKVSRCGLRARGIAPSDPAAHVIWNDPVRNVSQVVHALVKRNGAR